MLAGDMGGGEVMTIVFRFRDGDGFELKMKCKSFTVERNGLGEICGYKAEGITENKPIDFKFEDIMCIYRVLSDEEDGG